MKAGENTDTILSVMEHLHQPMFLLDVLGPESFVFRGLNKEHQAESGLTNDMVFGKSPHEALPSRLADTIVQNYERCRATGQAHTYEELLELPTGPLWWQTTLSPVFDDHRKLTQIIGLAVDITKRKEAEFGASQRLSDMTRLNEDLQVFASTTAQDMRGPFQTMVALLDMVSDGFVDLGDEKADQLALCREIAEDAITSMGAILSTAQGLRVATDTQEEVDLGHLAADIAALLDPHERFEIELPQAQIKADRVAIQMVLRNLMENAIRYTDKKVSVHVAAFKDALSGDMIAVTISDDGVGIAADKRIDGRHGRLWQNIPNLAFVAPAVHDRVAAVKPEGARRQTSPGGRLKTLILRDIDQMFDLLDHVPVMPRRHNFGHGLILVDQPVENVVKHLIGWQ